MLAGILKAAAIGVVVLVVYRKDYVPLIQQGRGAETLELAVQG